MSRGVRRSVAALAAAAVLATLAVTSPAQATSGWKPASPKIRKDVAMQVQWTVQQRSGGVIPRRCLRVEVLAHRAPLQVALTSLKRGCMTKYLAYWGEDTGAYLVVNSEPPGSGAYWFILGNTRQVDPQAAAGLACTYEELTLPAADLQATQEAIAGTGVCV